MGVGELATSERRAFQELALVASLSPPLSRTFENL